MNLKIAFGTILVLSAFAQASGQSEQRINLSVKSGQTVEERVADEIKAKELRKAGEERLAAEESKRIANTNPASLLCRARTMYIDSGTSFFEEIQLQNALQKRTEFADWHLAILEGWENSKVADLLINIDRPLFTYTFTYQIIDRSTGVVLATGKVTAWDGNVAAPKLASKILEEIKKARGATATNSTVK